MKIHYPSNLEAAIAFYTGNLKRVSCSAGLWKDLATLLESEEVFPQEFCHWLVHEGGANPGPAQLTFINYLLKVPSTDEYLQWKTSRKWKVDFLWKANQESLKARLSNGIDLAHTLASKCEEYVSPFRVEVALDKWNSTAVETYKGIVNEYGTSAYIQVIGNPQYIQYVPLFSTVCKNKNMDLIL